MRISISVIIVAYKSRSFIACCLSALYKAADGYEVEVVIVDNDSGDGIKSFVEEEYPYVRIIQNDKNIGFGAACNRGARSSTGEYLIFLNPDTIVSEDFFIVIIGAAKELPDSGILSPMLYDGRGRFLPESSRKIPTIRSAINKSLGWEHGSSQYYEPINEQSRQEIEIAPGAAMLIEGSKFKILGGFDERFFMYAEDIDLSYRSIKQGYTNYLIKDAHVIHFKGESTSKGGWDYNRYFYSTMADFVKKYRGVLYSNLDYFMTAIFTFFFSLLSFVFHTFLSAKTWLIDFALGVIVCFSVQFSWSYARYGVWDYFGYGDHVWSYILYVGIWIWVMLIGGAYWRDSNRRSTLKALSVGVLLSLVMFSLVPLEWRFSRAVISISGIMMLTLKYLRTGTQLREEKGRLVYVSSEDKESTSWDMEHCLTGERKLEIVRRSNLSKKRLGSGDQLLLRTDDNYDPVDVLLRMGTELKYSFVNTRTKQIISSHISKVPGERVDQLSHHNLSRKTFVFQKRMVDTIGSLLILFPLILYQLIWRKRIDLKIWKAVIFGDSTIVGFGAIYKKDEIVEISDYLIPCYSKKDSIQDRRVKIMNYSLHYGIFDDCYHILMNLSGLLRTYTYGRTEK